jgi:uncharacterized cupredoxin-like copper-binding protein
MQTHPHRHTTLGLITDLIAALIAGLILSTSLLSGHAFAHGNKKKAADAVKMEQTEWGIGAPAKQAVRTIKISMADTMRFTPEKIDVKKGETVTIVLQNRGRILHEFVIGTSQTLSEHAALMVKFPNMEHDEAYMAHVAPSKSGSITWTFNRVGEFDFACLIAGHFSAGMKGKIIVSAK